MINPKRLKWPLLVAIFISSTSTFACKMSMTYFDEAAKKALMDLKKLKVEEILSQQHLQNIHSKAKAPGLCPDVTVVLNSFTTKTCVFWTKYKATRKAGALPEFTVLNTECGL